MTLFRTFSQSTKLHSLTIARAADVTSIVLLVLELLMCLTPAILPASFILIDNLIILLTLGK